MGFGDILLILAIALVLFGPEELPEIARKIGKVVFEIRKATTEITKEFTFRNTGSIREQNALKEELKELHIRLLDRYDVEFYTKSMANNNGKIYGLGVRRNV